MMIRREVMTINPNRYALHFILVVLIIPCTLQGQQKDFQSWWEIQVNKGLKSGFSLSGELEQRFRNNSLQYDRTLVTLGGEYDVKDYLSVAAGLRALLVSDRELNLNPRYRLHLEGTGHYTLSGFDLSYRFRLQYGFDDLLYLGNISQNNAGARSRLKVAYHIFGTRLGWFATIESWHHIYDPAHRLFYKMRYSAGALYTLNFSSELSLRYILESEFNVTNPLQSYILVFGYSHAL